MSIYTLQEVHCSADTLHLWSTEWGYKSLFSSLSSKRAGVSILFNNNFDLKILKPFSNDEGRYIICDVEACGKSLTLANIFAPNENSPTFFLTS